MLAVVAIKYLDAKLEDEVGSNPCYHVMSDSAMVVNTWTQAEVEAELVRKSSRKVIDMDNDPIKVCVGGSCP